MSFGKKLRHALAGISYAARESHFRFHCVVAGGAGIAGLLCSISHLEWAILFLLIGFVLVLEMMNTITEHMIDIFKPEFHEYAKLLKEVASGAVLLAAATAIVGGILIFGPRIMDILLR